jgi:hypothetical protein
MGVIGYNLQHAVLGRPADCVPQCWKAQGGAGEFPPKAAVCPDFLIVPGKGKSLVRGKSGMHPTGTGWYKNLMEIRLWKEE